MCFQSTSSGSQYLFEPFEKQIVIDSACATVAEVKQRADMFWKEFDFYASDMIVGIVMGM